VRLQTIQDPGCAVLAQAIGTNPSYFSNVQTLRLADNGITDQGVGFLSVVADASLLPALRLLDVSKNCLTATSAETLSHCLMYGAWATSLVSLHLAENSFGYE
jgi:Ran GTPase-activating protein (RanGAP) involved in mRNA processing and transport